MTASLDVIGSVDFGYRTLWGERHYFIRLATVPFIISFLCLVGLVATGWDQNFIRSALIMLPASFAQGWMLSHMVRLVLLGQRWPFQPAGDPARDAAMLEDRAFGIISGTLFFVLVKLAHSGLMSVFTVLQGASQKLTNPSDVTAGAETSLGMAVLALALLVGTVWIFRYAFLYIPAAAGLSLSVLTRWRGAFALSLQLLGVWLVSVIPCLLLVVLMLAGLIPGEGAKAASWVNQSVILGIQAMADMIMAALCTLSVAFGLRGLIEKPD